MGALEDAKVQLLDREPALSEIDSLIAEARARGEWALVRVTGRAGIGKTAVLAAFVTRFHGRARFVSVQPAHYVSSGSVARELIGVDGDGSNGASILRERLGVLAADYDLLVIDDIQWLDEVTLHMLRALVRHDANGATFLVGDRRDDAPELPPHRTVALPPLRRPAALELVRRRFPGVAKSVADDIVDSCDGLPFALTFLADDAALHAAGRTHDSVPSVRGAVVRRLARTRSLARDAARLVALIDPPVLLSAVAAALGASVRDVASALVDLGDLVAIEGANLAFRHAAIADAVAVTVPDTVAAYSQLLQAYDTEEDVPVVLATIVRCATGCANRNRAATTALRLARILAREGSLRIAMRYAEVALENAERPLPPAYAITYAVILQQLAQDDKAAVFLRNAIRTAIERDDAASAVDLLASFCSAAITLERFVELEGLCWRVESMPSCSTAIQGRTRTIRLAMLAYAGRVAEYVQLAEAQELVWADMRTSMFVHGIAGDAAAAAVAAEAYTAGLRTEHDRHQPSDRLLERAIAFFNGGPRALDELDDLPSGAERHPSERALRVLSRIADGRWDLARASLAVHDDEAVEPDQILEVRLLLAALAADATADERSLSTLRTMIARRRLRHAVVPARWYVIAKHPVPADIEGFVAETLLVEPMPYAFAGLPLAVARLAERLGSKTCRAALERFPVYGSTWHRAHRDLAFGLMDRDNEKIRSARDAFEATNMPTFATIAGIALPVPRARDVAVGRRLGFLSETPSQSGGLTPRERDVAELTARGCSNREIGSALGIADRTVETHLTKIFAKLRVTSRSGLAARLLENDSPGKLGRRPVT